MYLEESNLQRQQGEGRMPEPETGRNGELLSNGHKVSIWEDGKFLAIEGGDGCATAWMYLMPLNCTLKMVKIYLCYLYFTTI